MTPYEQVYLDYAECRSAPGLATCVPATEALLRLGDVYSDLWRPAAGPGATGSRPPAA